MNHFLVKISMTEWGENNIVTTTYFKKWKYVIIRFLKQSLYFVQSSICLDFKDVLRKFQNFENVLFVTKLLSKVLVWFK